MQLPKMYRLRQRFSRTTVADIATAVRTELAGLNLGKVIRPNQKIGITVGSRGIRDLLALLKTCIHFLKDLGAVPYLVAAMGSHGGGSEHGQQEVLESLGITETNLGAPVLTCAECLTIAHTPGGLRVFVLKSALSLDGILLVNRVKTHTSFKGPVESGLVKMLVVGLGGPKGAQQFHGFGPGELPTLLPAIAEVILRNLPVLGGLAIVENAYEETALIRAVPRDHIIELESELLAYSKTLMPSLPVDEIDLLIVEQIGKNFSGTGMDTNIIGRARIQGVPEPEKPSIKRIAVLDLSEEAHGNATGIGMADFVTKLVVDKMDRQATYLNCLTSTFVVRAAIPMYFDTEEELVNAAVTSLRTIPPNGLRIVIIRNTLYLNECLVSEAVAEEVRGREGIELANAPESFTFDGHKRLTLRIPSHQNAKDAQAL
jgi:hypothetical protein